MPDNWNHHNAGAKLNQYLWLLIIILLGVIVLLSGVADCGAVGTC